MKIEGVEICPHCEDENEFKVDEGTWIINCKTCGRPIVLCDKCFEMITMKGQEKDCVNCKHCKKCDKMNRKFEKEQIGNIVYWNDPDDGMCSNYCKIIGFKDSTYELSPLNIDKEGMHDGSIVEAYGYELEFLTEERQVEVLVAYFNNCANWKV